MTDRALSGALKVLGDGLKEARLRAGFNQQQVAASLKVTYQTVSNWEGGRHEPKPEHLEALGNLYAIPVEQLIPESDRRGRSGEGGARYNVHSPDGFTIFPIKGYVSAGSPREAWEMDLGTISLPQTKELLRQAPNVFVLVVSGNSLEGDGIEDGETLLVDPDAGLQVGSIHIVRIGDEFCARHVFIEEGGLVRLKASNDQYEEITAKEVTLVGKVVGHIKYRSL